MFKFNIIGIPPPSPPSLPSLLLPLSSFLLSALSSLNPSSFLLPLLLTQNIDYRLRFTASEWARIEHELTRERGLWGPERPSQLDKWMLDSVEGPSRMRKRMCHNHLFYHHYSYHPGRESVVGC